MVLARDLTDGNGDQMKRLALLVLCSTALLAIGCSKTENTAGTSNTNATTGSNATAGPATTERTRATTRTTARTTGTTAPGGGSLASQLKEFQSAMQAEGLPVTDDQ